MGISHSELNETSDVLRNHPLFGKSSKGQIPTLHHQNNVTIDDIPTEKEVSIVKEKRICSCRILMFQNDQLHGNSILYDSFQDKGLRRMFLRMFRRKDVPKDGLNNMKLMSEMQFGALPMKITNNNTKIHILPSCRQTMFTKLFNIAVPSNWVNFQSLGAHDSDSSTDVSELSSHLGSKQKGEFMCKSTFSLGVVLTLHKEHYSDSEFQKQSSAVQRMILSHYAIIDLRIRKLLRICMEEIQICLKHFLKSCQENNNLSRIFHGLSFSLQFPNSVLQKNANVGRAVRDFQKFIHSFIHAPRLDRVLWMEKNLFASKKNEIFEVFMKNFTSFKHNHTEFIQSRMPKPSNISFRKVQEGQRVHQFSNKFLASVFTAILSNHLSWVALYLGIDHADDKNLAVRKLNSIYGSGYLSHKYENQLKRHCRVVVVGSNQPLIEELLCLLTYLIRCDNTAEKEYFIDDKEARKNSLPPDPIPIPIPKKNHRNLQRTSIVSPIKGQNMSDHDPSSVDSMSSVLDRFFSQEEAVPVSPTTKSKFLSPNSILKNIGKSPLSSPEKFNQVRLMEISPYVKNKNLSQVSKKLDFHESKGSESIEIPLTTSTFIDYEEIFHNNRENIPKKLGHSLYAGISPLYCGAFVLSALSKNVEFLEDSIADMKLILTETGDGNETPVHCTCIVIDTDEFLCNAIQVTNNYKSKENSRKDPSIQFEEMEPSPFILSLVEELERLSNQKLSSDVTHELLQDKLGELVLWSHLISETIIDLRENDLQSLPISYEEMAKLVGLHVKDIPLICSIISCYNNHLLTSLVPKRANKKKKEFV